MDVSILSGYFAILDENFNLVEDLALQVKPDDGIYHVTGGAMAVNGINLIEHDKVAITYKAAKPLLYEFLWRNGRGEKLTPVGHGVKIDVDWTKEHLISEGSWETFVSYRTLCTSSAAQFLRAQGKIPKEVSGSLGSLASFLGLPSVQYHDAKNDTMQTVLVLQELLKL
jgi:hypothetical protein